MKVQDLADAIRSGDRAALPRAITLLESTRADHREQAQQLLLELLPDAGALTGWASPGCRGWASPPPSKPWVYT